MKYFLLLCMLTLIPLGAPLETRASDILRSDQSMPGIDPLGKPSDAPLSQYNANDCTELLSVLPAQHHRYQPGVGARGETVISADIDQLDLLGKATRLRIQPEPGTASQQTVTTESTSKTVDDVTVKQETITTQTPSSFSTSFARPIDVVLDHRNALVIVNGKVTSSVELRQLQESCQRTLR